MSATKAYWRKQEFEKREGQSLNATITLATGTNTGFVVAPFTGTIDAIYSVINGVLTTGDETLSFAVTGGTTMGDIVVTQSGSAKGDVDSLVPTANNTVVAGDTIDITTDGANGTATIATVTIVFSNTAA